MLGCIHPLLSTVEEFASPMLPSAELRGIALNRKSWPFAGTAPAHELRQRIFLF
jgi:hypothetical protein